MSNGDIPRPGETAHTRVGEQSILHQREFDVTAALVQSAHTGKELFSQWMGPRGTIVRIERFDPITGGSFRYFVESPSGGSWAFRGSYHSVEPGLILHTWQYEPEPDVTFEALRFIDLPGGRCCLEVTSTYQSKESCGQMVVSGFDDGMDENFKRLDEVLQALKA